MKVILTSVTGLLCPTKYSSSLLNDIFFLSSIVQVIKIIVDIYKIQKSTQKRQNNKYNLCRQKTSQ